MPIGEKPDNEALHKVFLSYDDLVDLPHEGLQKGTGFFDLFVDGTNSGIHISSLSMGAPKAISRRGTLKTLTGAVIRASAQAFAPWLPFATGAIVQCALGPRDVS